MTAIVWDLMTGDEVARFASYENLTCAAWMRNGNVAFGMLFGSGTIGIGSRADCAQAILREASYCSSLRHQNTSRQGQLTRLLSQQLLPQRIAGHLLLGKLSINLSASLGILLTHS